jgi:ABC-type methionine transport system permease subunit
MTAVRNLDLVLLATALPVFLLAGLPVGGWVAGALAWGLYRGVGAVTERAASRATEPGKVAGLAVGSAIGRVWTLILILFAAGLLVGRDVGLAAAVLTVAVFTTYFVVRLVLREAPATGPHHRTA